MPRSRLMLNSAAASAAPVEPPETSACARPAATAAAACTIDESGWRRTAAAGSGVFAIESGASITSTPAPTGPISRAGPNSSTPIPCAAARSAPAATSRGPRSAPPASTATVTIARRSVGFAGRRDHLAPLVVAAHGAHAVGQARAVALRARVVARRAQLVLRATLRGARMRLLLLGYRHLGAAG